MPPKLNCTHRAYQFWDGGWVKKNDQVASPMDPVEGVNQLQQPGGSQGRPTAFLSGRRTGQEVYTRRLCPRLYPGDRGLSPD